MENIPLFTDAGIIGSYFRERDVEEKSNKVVISKFLANKWTDTPDDLIGETLTFEENSYEVIGILDTEADEHECHPGNDGLRGH